MLFFSNPDIDKAFMFFCIIWCDIHVVFFSKMFYQDLTIYGKGKLVREIDKNLHFWKIRNRGRRFSFIYASFLAHLSWRLKWAFLIKICPLSVVVVVVNFSHFHLLLQNQWANFNQTWHKASSGKGDSSLFKWPRPFPGGDNCKIAKIYWQI